MLRLKTVYFYFYFYVDTCQSLFSIWTRVHSTTAVCHVVIQCQNSVRIYKGACVLMVRSKNRMLVDYSVLMASLNCSSEVCSMVFVGSASQSFIVRGKKLNLYESLLVLSRVKRC